MENIKFVGVDDGHYALKLCFEHEGQLKTLSMPSRAAYGKILLADTSTGLGNNDCMYICNDVPFTVLENVMSLKNEVIDLRTINYPCSDVNAVLIYHALVRAGFSSGDSLNIVTGLPFKEFYLNGSRNNDLIKQKSDNLVRHVLNLDPSVSLPHIHRHSVMAEGAGAYIDMILNIDGTENSDMVEAISESPMAIVDIGGKTTDIVTMDTGGSKMRMGESSTGFIGALDLNDAISNELKRKLNLTTVVPEKIETAITSGVYSARGIKHDVSDIILTEKMLFARKIQDEVRRTLKDASNIGMVAFVGGGSNLIKKELYELYGSQSNFVEEPQFANARGFYKASKYMIPVA